MEHEMSIQIKVAVARASDAAERGINHQQTPAKVTRPMLSMAAPKASSAAASVPRRHHSCPFLFTFPFVLFNQGGTGRKYGLEGQKKPAYPGTPLSARHTGENCYAAAGDKPQGVFMPFGLFQS
jgi:hypothetical protein